MHSQNSELYKIILVGTGILTAVLAYFIISIVRQQRKVFKWKSAQNRAGIETLENERRRIAADLHDEIGPVLSAVKLQINHLEPADETEQVVLNKSSDQIDHVIQRFREISYDLLPNTLVRKGLVKATEEFIERMRVTKQLLITFNSVDIRLPSDKEVNIYRIFQEIIHNTIKHARATTLIIDMKLQNDLLIIRTTDDGIGFNYQQKRGTDGGLGLLNLQSRVEVMQGNLKIETQPGKGTLYTIEIPM